MARGQQTEKKKKPIKYFDYSLLFLIIFLLCFGLVMLYSTSSYAGSNKFGDASYFVKRQLFATGLGIVGMYIVSKIPYRFWMKVSSMAYLAAIVLCTAVIFIGTEANGQARWLKIGPLSFQPSEFAKFAVIIFLATVIYKTPQKMGEFMSLVKIMVIVLPIVAVVAYNNLSTAIIILGIAVCMLFVASPKYSHFVLMAAAVGVVGVVFISFEAYRMDRIKIWLNPEAYEKGYQTLQGLYAIGSGGLFGKGLGESMQKLGFIPEAQNDMIFSIVCEELGVFGAALLLLMFGYLLYRLFFIAQNAPDLYGTLVVTGIFVHIALQVILNLCVVLNLMPTTGITLPFVSYGGTSILFLMAEMGIALSVSGRIQTTGEDITEVETA